MFDAQGFIVDRLQQGGVSNLNQPQEIVKELGNVQNVGITRDTPDLSFELQALDMSTEIEAILLGMNPTLTAAGQEYDFNASRPLDILSPFKTSLTNFAIVKSIIVPYLTLESVTYRFGVKANAEKSFTLRGDSVFYSPGSAFYEQFAGNGVTTSFAFAHTAIKYAESGVDIYALGLCYIRSDGTYKRLFHGADYTDTAAGFTLTTAAPAGATIKVVYASTAASNYPQSVNAAESVKPSALRGKDIDVYIGDTGATPTFTRMNGVQSIEATRRVTLDADSELGNPRYVEQTYDTPDVNGQIVFRGVDPTDLWAKIATLAGVPSTQVVGPLLGATLPVEIRASHPTTGARLETLYIPDAQFTPPATQGRVGQKVDVTFPWTSAGGTLKAYQGSRP